MSEASLRWLAIAEALMAALGADGTTRASEFLRAAREHLNQTEAWGEAAA